MTPARPTLGLLRSLTDEHVLRALLAERRLTRAALAARTGISKPTVAESVRRLAEAGLVRDTGERTAGRGRAGSYYALADGLGEALVVDVGPVGIVAERVDLYGEVVGRAEEEITAGARVAAAIVRCVKRAGGGSGPARLAVVSVADPVDRATGRLVELPDSPFLIGELDPPGVLAPFVTGPVITDNDVNWAARAELADAPADLGYLFLGSGLGCAVVSDGAVRRGHGGLAGEVSHLITVGPDGAACAFTEVFRRLGLHRPGSSAIDTDRVLAALAGSDAESERTAAAIADAVCGAVVTLVAVLDPGLLVLGGPWGAQDRLIDLVGERLRSRPRQVPIRASRAAADGPLRSAREHARDVLRAEVLFGSGQPTGGN